MKTLSTQEALQGYQKYQQQRTTTD